MLFLIGIKKDVDIHIRERLNINKTEKEEILKAFLNEFNEAVILNTCNRCEIYINCHGNKDNVLNKIISILKWDIYDKEYLFIKSDKECVKHLFEVSCGLHSKIKGEDQILGQVRNAYIDSVNVNAAKGILGRMFEMAINCGKTFRSKSKLYEIPVSVISIVVNKLIEYKCSNVMVIGYGKMGELAIKYLIQNGFNNIILAVRNTLKASNSCDTKKVKVININDKNEYINYVDGIISCTSSKNTIIEKQDINSYGNKLICFDIALPRDISKDVYKISRVKVYNIDEISKIDDKNKTIREKKMKSYSYVIDKCVEDYMNYLKLRNVSPVIKKLKDNVNNINNKRIDTFHNKGNKKGLVETMINSTSNVYLNRAIEILKEETLKGREKECIKIIERIFKEEN